MPAGVVHKLPADVRGALIANPTALDARRDITPLARNWIRAAAKRNSLVVPSTVSSAKSLAIDSSDR